MYGFGASDSVAFIDEEGYIWYVSPEGFHYRGEYTGTPTTFRTAGEDRLLSGLGYLIFLLIALSFFGGKKK